MGKGDADNLRADLDDGWGRLAWLFHEALFCAPLSGNEFRIVHFIIRRTYCWAPGTKPPPEYKFDTISAEEIARATGLTKGSVSNSLAILKRSRVIVSPMQSAGIKIRYGLNPQVSEWGDDDRRWRGFLSTLIDARSLGLPNRIDPSPKRVYRQPDSHSRNSEGSPGGEDDDHSQNSEEGTHEKMSPLTRISEGASALSPTGTGPEGPCTDSCTEKVQIKDTDSGADEAAPRAETEMQKVIREAWEAVGLPGVPEQPRDPKSGRPLGKSYGYLGKLLNQHGFDLVREWTRHVKSHPVPDGCKCINHRLPEGAKPWDWFVEAMADGLNQPFNWRGQNGLAPTTGPYASRQNPARPMGPTKNRPIPSMEIPE